MILKKELIVVITFLISNICLAQQDAQFTHYIYNMTIVNPAYTLEDYGDIRIGALHRSQWVGLTGNPTSSVLFGQYMQKSKLQLGLSFINDNIGKIVSENTIYADIAYKLHLSRYSNLSLGVKLGLSFFGADINNLRLQSENTTIDPAFENNISRHFFNVGFGLYYNTNKFFIGLSVPNVIESKHLDSNSIIKNHEKAHAFLIGGYVFNASKKLKIKPSFLVKGVVGAPLSLDLNTNLLINEKVELGLSYRLEDALSAIAGITISDGFYIGYSYDYNISRLNDFNSGSHEIILTYKINLLSKGYDKSPRFF